MSPRWTLRPGMPRDAAPLAAFAARTFEETFAHSTTPADMAEHLARSYSPALQQAELEDAGQRTILVESHGTILGFSQVRQRPVPAHLSASGAVELRRFYLDRSLHGSGAATALLDRTKEEAAAIGGAAVWLSVWEQNERARAFYLKSGFRDIGSDAFWVGQDCQTDRILLLDLGTGGA